MKIMDKNGRLFGKISVIDVAVLLVALCMAGALYMKTNTMTHTSTVTAMDTITYTFYCYGMPEYVEGQIQVGDKIYDSENTVAGSLGEIMDVQYFPGTQFAQFRDGTAGYVSAEGTVNILLTIQGSGIISDSGYQLNRVYPLGVNANRNFCTPYVMMSGTVRSIED